MALRPGNPRTVVVPESFFEALGIRLVKDFGPNAAENLLYEIGRDAGRSFVRMSERSGGRRAESADSIRGLVQRFVDFGWAEIELQTLDVPGKFAVVEWKNGVAVPKGGSPLRVCHLGRGLLSGAAEVAFDAPCDAIETKCQAMGAEHCEIVVGVPERVALVAEALE